MAVISTRFRPDEADVLRRAAAERHLTVSAFMRWAALRAELLARPGTQAWVADNGAEIVLWTNLGRAS